MTAPAVVEELAASHLDMLATGPDESVAYVATKARASRLARLRLVEQNQTAAPIRPKGPQRRCTYSRDGNRVIPGAFRAWALDMD